MKVNSELPLCLLGQNEEINEYDFVLYHLYKHHKQYRDHFRQLRETRPDRLMILDNSAYEFFVVGEQIELPDFINTVHELKPDMWILPDKLMDMRRTIDGVLSALDLYGEESDGAMGVIQGRSEEEMAAMMVFYQDLNVKNIAIPFHLSVYKDLAHPKVATDIRGSRTTKEAYEDSYYAAGRVMFVERWMALLSEFDHVHLLGSHNPSEKHFYPEGVIDTFDTGYPVKCAVEGHRLFSEPHKPDIIIDSFVDSDLSQGTKDLIVTNINLFKQ